MATTPVARCKILHSTGGLRAATTTAEAPATAAAAGGGTSGTGSQKQDSKKQDDQDPPLGWGRFLLYGSSGFASLIFLYYFHKAKYSIHRTEILLLERWRTLPLYPAPGPPPSEENSHVDPMGLPHDLVDVFAEWFIFTDARESGGVTRDDVLELFHELGFGEEEQPCKDFLMRGEGQLEERRRLSGAGLQESIALLAKLALPQGSDEAGAPRPEPRVGRESVELLKRKLVGVGSVLNAASALQQAMQTTGAASPSTVDAAAAPAEAMPPAPAPTLAPAQLAPVAGRGAEVSEDASDAQAGTDDDHHRRMEATRLAKVEQELVARLERNGSLSPAEEARLRDVREKKAAL